MSNHIWSVYINPTLEFDPLPMTMLSSENGRATSMLDATDTQIIVRDDEKQQKTDEAYLVKWDGVNDPLDPRTFSAARKWFYVAVVAMGSLLV